MVDRTIRTIPAISGDRTIYGENRNKWEVLCPLILLWIIELIVTLHLLAILGNLIFLRIVGVAFSILRSDESTSPFRFGKLCVSI